jgi:hypothetical protein
MIQCNEVGIELNVLLDCKKLLYLKSNDTMLKPWTN